MKKFRLYFDKDKEEAWLNEMSRQGFAMADFFAGLYVFVPCEPGKYIYRVDMPDGIDRAPIWKTNREYIELVEEMGAEFVCRWGWWMIFRREASMGEFTLYTDKESQAALYRRIRRLFLLAGCLELSIALSNCANVWHFWNRAGGFSVRDMDLILAASLFLCWFMAAGVFGMAIKMTKKMKALTK